MIGKPITASTIGLSPEIVVTAPALSTIDILKNNVIVQTYTLTGAETQHTFYVPLGTYVVRATYDICSNEETVAVDTVASYPVTITYNLWLYKDGDECTDVTGGWKGIPIPNHSQGTIPPVTKNATSIFAGWTNAVTNFKQGILIAENAIDFSNYSTLKIHIIQSNVKTTAGQYAASLPLNLYINPLISRDNVASKMLTPSIPLSGEYATYTANYSYSDTEISLDISNISGAYTLGIHIKSFHGGAGDSYSNITFDKVWLEK